MLDHIVGLVRSGAGEEKSFEEIQGSLVGVVRERMLVSLGNVGWGAEMPKGASPALPANDPISLWFLRALVIDAPTQMIYVTDEQLRRWNLTFDEAFRIGLENLKAATVPKFEAIEGFFRGAWGDAYDASRVLVPGVFDDLPFSGDPVFVLPNRDTLLVADSANADAVRAMLAKAEVILNEMPRPQNPSPLTLQGGEMVEYTVPPGSPNFLPVSRARALARLRAYSEQKSVLEKVYEREGKDIYVGEHTLGTRKAGDGTTEYRSYCVWSRGVPTLLPVSDDVVFFDASLPEGSQVVAHVPWRRVREVLDEAMLDTQMYPERYYVSTFPSPEQVAELKR